MMLESPPTGRYTPLDQQRRARSATIRWLGQLEAIDPQPVDVLLITTYGEAYFSCNGMIVLIDGTGSGVSVAAKTAATVQSPDGTFPETHLSLMGDWGVANWHTLAGWLAAGLRWRTSPASTFVIHTLGAYKDSVESVMDRTCDVCVATPVVTAAMARAGIGPFPEAHQELRSVAVLPHRDRLMLAVGEDVAERHGLKNLADLARVRPPLRLVTAVRDGVNGISFAVERLLDEHGMRWGDIPEWGGEWLATARPHGGIASVGKGEADGIFFEAAMNWHRLERARPLRFLGFDPSALDSLHERFGYDRVDLEPGEYTAVTEPTPVLDFSDWLIVTRADLPDEIAYLMAQVVVEDRAEFERHYLHKPRQESALHYPIDPRRVGVTGPVPLHDGSARYFRQAGLI